MFLQKSRPRIIDHSLKIACLHLGGVWYMGIGSENRHLISFLPYSYVWINVKKVEMK